MTTPAREYERTLKWPKMRPRFVVEVACSADQVMSSLRERGEPPADGIDSRLSERHGVLRLCDDERQFWSTELGLTLEDGTPHEIGEPTPTRVLGIFSPQPEVWTGFVFAIGTLMGIAVFGSMVAIVQLAMGHPPWALLAPPIALLVGGLVYTSTLVGQGLAAGEMYRLRSHLDDCLERAEERAAREPRTARDSAQL